MNLGWYPSSPFGDRFIMVYKVFQNFLIFGWSVPRLQAEISWMQMTTTKLPNKRKELVVVLICILINHMVTDSILGISPSASASIIKRLAVREIPVDRVDPKIGVFGDKGQG